MFGKIQKLVKISVNVFLSESIFIVKYKRKYKSFFCLLDECGLWECPRKLFIFSPLNLTKKNTWWWNVILITESFFVMWNGEGVEGILPVYTKKSV